MHALRPATLSIYRRILHQSRPSWRYVLGIFALELLATPLALLKPVPLKIVVDSVVGSTALPHWLRAVVPGGLASAMNILFFAAALEVLIVLLAQVHSLATHYLRTQTGEKLVLELRARLFGHLQRLSLFFHDSKGTADSIYRVQDDAPAVKWIVLDSFLPLVTETIMLVTMLYVIIRINWHLAIVALTISPLLVLYARSYDRRVGYRYEGVKELESSALHVVQEVLSAVRVVKAFGREKVEQDRFVHLSGAGLKARLRLALAEGTFGVMVNITTALGTAIVLVIGIRSVLSGTLTVGDVLLVLSYLGQLYSPLETISTQAAAFQSYRASAQRVFEILDELPEVIERPDARPLARCSGAVEFRDVSFGYNRNRAVLKQVSVQVPAGTSVGIVGRTGAGKTTLISLLIRFYDPTSGQILLDGVDLRDYRLADLRAQFALVLQEPVLFSTTIAENIAYARPNATEQEIVEAAKAANAHDFIVGLPDGYQTQVGERGMMLSGGERQRLSLARAFLRNAPILILDEPTSAVDVKTEAGIIEAMERLMRGRTSFLISHRQSALTHCDLVLKIEAGRAGEVRNPAPLLAETAVSARRSSEA